MDSKQKQHAIIEFLMKEECSLSDVHRRLQNVYRNDTIDKINMHRWTKFKEGKTRLQDKPRSGCEVVEQCIYLNFFKEDLRVGFNNDANASLVM